jgi:hypothetical protein
MLVPLEFGYIGIKMLPVGTKIKVKTLGGYLFPGKVIARWKEPSGFYVKVEWVVSKDVWNSIHTDQTHTANLIETSESIIVNPIDILKQIRKNNAKSI